MLSDPFAERTRAVTLALVRHTSITETDGERSCADTIVALLRAHPYFAQHPADVWVLPTAHDFLPRQVVYALVRGHGPQTVILTGHYDVVSTANYGALEPLATDPERLLPALIEALVVAPDAADAASQQALDDLRSGDWMPGRGALDMKSGLAAGLAVLERFAELPERDGNLLMVFVPDEENYSHGMRSAAAQLTKICAERNLDPALAINLDAAVNTGDGSDGRAIFLGTVGKLLPFAHVIGRPTHVGAPFDGLSAPLIAAELMRELEANPAYGDALPTDGERPPVPVALRAKDLKDHYDVTTPEQVCVALNVLTYRRSPAEVLSAMRTAARHALDAAHALMADRARRVEALSGQPTPFGIGAGEVIALSDVLKRVGEAPVAEIVGDRTLDVLAMTQRAVSVLARAAGVVGPAVIVGFAPVRYPQASFGESEASLRAALAEVAGHIGHETGGPILLRPFFTGISDMSFLGTGDAAGDSADWAANTIGAERWRMPANPLRVPVVNIGPWGREYHQRTERVHMPYSFGVLPKLLWAVTTRVLSA
jgi:arginine utilization protein RocB